jgi:YVTN family beta-propeller protein
MAVFSHGVRLALLVLLACPMAQASGLLLVGNKSAHTLWALDAVTGERRAEAPTAPGPHELAVAPDRRLVVVSEYGERRDGATLAVFELPALGLLRRIDLGAGAAPHGSAFLPDGRLLVTTEGRGELVEVDVATGVVMRRIAVGEGSAHMVAVSPGGRRAWVSNISTGTLTRVDLEAGRSDGSVRSGTGAEGLAVSADGAEVWVCNRGEDSVAVIDADTLAVRATLAAPGFPIRVKMTPEGRHALVTRARAAMLSVFEVATRRQIAEVALAEPDVAYRDTLLGRAALPVGLAVHPDGTQAFVALSGGDEVVVLDTATWTVRARWGAGREPDALGVVLPPASAQHAPDSSAREQLAQPLP